MTVLNLVSSKATSSNLGYDLFVAATSRIDFPVELPDSVVPTFEYAGSFISPKAVMVLTVVVAITMAVVIGLGFRGVL